MPSSKFLSTPSARRATALRRAASLGVVISIHALREEGDQGSRLQRRWRSYFYPRPPRGGRPLIGVKSSPACMISIHALREEGDQLTLLGDVVVHISIHALREEGDKMTKR